MKYINGTDFFQVKTGQKLFKSKQNWKNSSQRKQLNLFAMNVFFFKGIW